MRSSKFKLMVAGLPLLVGMVAAGLLTATAQSESGKELDWLMRSHDAQRTGCTKVVGPKRAARVWQYAAADGLSINLEPSTGDSGVFFGTWGLIRKSGPLKADWDKFDGRLIGLDLKSGQPLWPPLHPGKTPYAYKYNGRMPTAQDRAAGPGYHLNFSNGTIEGTPAIDAARGVLYFGRGDGKLYAVNLRDGRILWKFATYDPARPDDPESGGEIVGGPLMTSNNLIIFGTFAAPPSPRPPRSIRHETNAIYCVDASSGALVWRYPQTGTLQNVFNAPLALSANGRRVYAVTQLTDVRFECELLALDTLTGRLFWKVKLGRMGGQDLAVGSNSTIYIAGMMLQGLKAIPVAFAVEDKGIAGRLLFKTALLNRKGPACHFAGGLAVKEGAQGGSQLWVSTSNIRNDFLKQPTGKLYLLNPNSGAIEAEWDPAAAEKPTTGGLTDISVDGDGVVYVGVRGSRKGAGRQAVPGRMYALNYDRRRQAFDVLWSLPVEGYLDWASVAIGSNGGVYFGSTSEMSQFGQSFPRAANANVPGADAVFYGVHDSD